MQFLEPAENGVNEKKLSIKLSPVTNRSGLNCNGSACSFGFLNIRKKFIVNVELAGIALPSCNCSSSSIFRPIMGTGGKRRIDSLITMSRYFRSWSFLKVRIVKHTDGNLIANVSHWTCMSLFRSYYRKHSEFQQKFYSEHPGASISNTA